MYSSDTLKYLKNSDRNYRSKLGQFFTPASIVNKCYEYISLLNLPIKKVVEPSSGTGQFLNHSFLDDKEIEKYDIDEKLCNLTKSKCCDFLLEPFEEETKDLVIGNPPYFELTSTLKKKYSSMYIKGRYNIYALIIEESNKYTKNKWYFMFCNTK
jgi:type I restriction-modification system DNA methylase subunit